MDVHNYTQLYLVHKITDFFQLILTLSSPKCRNYGLHVGVSHSRKAGITAFSMVYQMCTVIPAHVSWIMTFFVYTESLQAK